MTIAPDLAPTGTLRVAVWTVPYFARERDGTLTGIIPDLGTELARRADMPVSLIAFANPAGIMEAFRPVHLDVAFLGMTADRAEVIDFGPVVLDIQTTYLVPATSPITSIAEIDRPGLRIAVPAKSAQEAHLNKPSRTPVSFRFPQSSRRRRSRCWRLESRCFQPRRADAGVGGRRAVRRAYFARQLLQRAGRHRHRERAFAVAAIEYAAGFVTDVKASGFVQQAILRAGVIGIVPAIEA